MRITQCLLRPEVHISLGIFSKISNTFQNKAKLAKVKKMSEKVVVTVKEGKVRGIKQTSKFSKAEFYSFYGIPYGQPPTGKLQYKDPVKVKPWNATYDATTIKPGCKQISLVKKGEILGNEDCLFTNIYTSKLPCTGEPLRPVIINIHPGALVFGTPNPGDYGSPEFVMHHDIVYVGIAYRLHMLGFMNLKLKECPGNQGIKDIIMALQWIKENISSFGGDPENITLLGSSSGASLINILMLSPAAQGLFHKGVIMGLHVTCPSAPFQATNEHHTRAIASSLGYEGDLNDNKKLLSFIKRQQLEDLIQEQKIYQKVLHENLVPTLPCGMFGTTLDYGPILPEPPKNLIKSMAKIPLIVGFCDRESVMGFTHFTRVNTEKNFKTAYRQNYCSWGHDRTDDDVKLITKEMESFYTNGQPIEQASLSVKENIQTDIILSDLYDTLIDEVGTEAPVYVYKFRFDGDNSSLKQIMTFLMKEQFEGTYHGTDFSYWNCFQDIHDKATRQMIETFTKLIVTFAATGNPNHSDLPVQWEPSKPDKPCYLSINNELEMIEGKLNHERSEFWDAIVKRYKN